MTPVNFLDRADRSRDIHHRGDGWVTLQPPSEAETVERGTVVAMFEKAQLQPRHVFTTLRNALLISSYLYDFHL
jgi:hypothetical protein